MQELQVARQLKDTGGISKAAIDDMVVPESVQFHPSFFLQ